MFNMFIMAMKYVYYGYEICLLWLRNMFIMGTKYVYYGYEILTYYYVVVTAMKPSRILVFTPFITNIVNTYQSLAIIIVHQSADLLQ